MDAAAALREAMRACRSAEALAQYQRSLQEIFAEAGKCETTFCRVDAELIVRERSIFPLLSLPPELVERVLTPLLEQHQLTFLTAARLLRVSKDVSRVARAIMEARLVALGAPLDGFGGGPCRALTLSGDATTAHPLWRRDHETRAPLEVNRVYKFESIRLPDQFLSAAGETLTMLPPSFRNQWRCVAGADFETVSFEFLAGHGALISADTLAPGTRVACGTPRTRRHAAFILRPALARYSLTGSGRAREEPVPANQCVSLALATSVTNAIQIGYVSHYGTGHHASLACSSDLAVPGRRAYASWRVIDVTDACSDVEEEEDDDDAGGEEGGGDGEQGEGEGEADELDDDWGDELDDEQGEWDDELDEAGEWGAGGDAWGAGGDACGTLEEGEEGEADEDPLLGTASWGAGVA